ncbi:unnamed protein product [Staurois parvus]|uniref:FBA domain-containing protein n=1 Tax=Staurois parvus TaxID=386267 RepID=A0ABN9GGK6_9NEOB|nr:unnamed protein product [Staurois parvus]
MISLCSVAGYALYGGISLSHRPCGRGSLNGMDLSPSTATESHLIGSCSTYFIRKRGIYLKNIHGQEGFNYWEISTMSMHMWKIEILPRDYGQPFPDDKVKECFFVPNGGKRQVIDLEKEGYPEQWMDVMQPDIIVRDWYSTKPNFTSTYFAHVVLLSKKKEAIQDFLPGLQSDLKWTQIEYRFRHYGPGVRYIHFEHGAGDMGRPKGARVTNSSITIEPEDLST